MKLQDNTTCTFYAHKTGTKTLITVFFFAISFISFCETDISITHYTHRVLQTTYKHSLKTIKILKSISDVSVFIFDGFIIFEAYNFNIVILIYFEINSDSGVFNSRIT